MLSVKSFYIEFKLTGKLRDLKLNFK